MQTRIKLLTAGLFLAAIGTGWSQPVITKVTNYNASVSVGASARMQVWASGTPPLSYQWWFGGLPLAGKTASILNLTEVQTTDAGHYTVVVTNAGGALTSAPVVLDVDGTFTKILADDLVTDTTASAWRPQAWADFDGDGKLDVLAVTWDTNFVPLYRNNGDGTFTRLLAPGLQGQTGGALLYLTWGDYDNDGYPDLFGADFSAYYGGTGNNMLFHNNGNGTFTRITSNTIVQDGRTCYMGAWGDFNRDGYLDLIVGSGSFYGQARDLFYQNRGDGTFFRLTNPITSELGNFVAPVWVDVDDDGWPDLFITEAYTNRLYRNLGNGNFSKVTGEPLVTDPGHYWYSSAWADYDNDGDLDAFITGFGDTTTDLRPVALYRNEGSFHFTKMTTNDIGPLAAERLYSWSCAWGDYDNDGWIDLFVGNGIYQSDGNSKCVMYRNNGNGTFTKITAGSPVNDSVGIPWVQWVDYDQDGFLDLFAACRDGTVPHRLYRNNGNSNNWLCVQCVGTASPRFGTGAKVRAKATIRGKEIWQLRLIDAGGSGSSFVAHFGLGDATNVDTLRIEWTSGIVQELHNVAAKQYLTLTEPAKLSMAQPGQLQIQCWNGMTYRIDSSPDLATWTQRATVTCFNPTGGIQWTDPAAPGPATRFYRAVKQ